MVANRQGREDVARYFRQNRAGGESWYSMQNDPYVRSLPYVWTDDYDIKFIDWCLDNGYGCCFQYQVHHMTYLDSKDANGNYLMIDNNYPDRVQRLTRAQLLSLWRGGGWAGTLVFDGAMPYPLIKGN